MAYSTAWNLLLDLRALDWSTMEGFRAELCGTTIEIAAGGEWRVERRLPREEAALLDVLLPLVVRPGGLVIGQLGQSLDGRIATEGGDSWYINGEPARAHLHRLRALVDAVLVGAGTASEDRPALTVRHVFGPDPVPVILDPRGRVATTGPLFERSSGQPPVLHLVGPACDLPPAPFGVERLVVPTSNDGQVAPQWVIQALAERGLRRVLVEGGGLTVSRFVDADCLDHLHLLIAPLLIGSGRPGLVLPPIQQLSAARRPPMRSFPLGDELLVDLRLR
ncbi:MAG: RibD family protein [Wenzhouxiangella sp.]|nr:RibD family protein [Wenzhouxiangella sp.]